MKKTALILAIFMTLSVLFSLPISAAESNNLNVNVICYYEGEERKIAIETGTKYKTAGISGTVKCDSKLDIVSVDIDGNISNINKSADSFTTENDNEFDFMLLGDAISGGTEGVWFKTAVKTDETNGIATISIADYIATNASGRLVEETYETVNIQLNWVYGDATGDEIVDARDLVRIKKRIVGLDDNAVKYDCNSDLNADKQISAMDLASLRQILLK